MRRVTRNLLTPGHSSKWRGGTSRNAFEDRGWNLQSKTIDVNMVYMGKLPGRKAFALIIAGRIKEQGTVQGFGGISDAASGSVGSVDRGSAHALQSFRPGVSIRFWEMNEGHC
jgi:hypothetical protein